MITLRDYQQAGIDRARSLVNSGRRRILIVGPCGSGKGHTIAAMLTACVQRGNRALMIAHRRELILDQAERVGRFGFRASVILPGAIAVPDWRVTVASVQTLARRDKPVADLLIVDEAHRAMAESYQAIFACYPNATIVGFTATPVRMSGAPLGDLFEEMIEIVTPAELVERGLLVPVVGYAFDAPDLRHVKRTAGDFNESELATLCDTAKVRGNVVEEWHKRARHLKTLIFCVNVAHSEKLAADIRAKGVAAEHIDGTASREERAAILERFKSGQTRVLTNCALFVEGVDIPSIECVCLAAPTMSTSRALQEQGRGRRPVPCECGTIPHWRAAACECGRPVLKRKLLLLDFGSVVFTHGLPDEPRAWSLTQSFRVAAPGKKSEASAGLRVCSACFGIYLADLEACPYCGNRNPKTKRLVRNAQGVAVSLAELERKTKPPDSSESATRRYFFYLLGLEREKGFKTKYAEIRFKGRFGFWPKLSKQWRDEFNQGAKT